MLLVLISLAMGSIIHADALIEGRAGRAELRFLEGMIDHHQMALDMANDCLENADSDSVTSLCQTIIDAQSVEISLMQGWLLDWYNVEYAPVSMMDMSAMDDMGHAEHSGMPFTDPSMMMGMMAGLNRLDGVDYDIAWLESMIDHHDDAIHMSERLLGRIAENGGHADLIALAEQIIADQSAEIDAMELLLSDLSTA